jgi:predicted amidohydrolase YtcJ
MQPVHAVVDAPVARAAWGARTDRAYPWRTLLSAGARLVFGSDAPVETPSVMAGLAAATSRGGWHPEQTVDMRAALSAYTLAPAQVTGQGDLLGSLAPGKLADLVALDGDPFEGPPGEPLPSVKATMIAGRWVWRRPDADVGGPVHTGSPALTTGLMD